MEERIISVKELNNTIKALIDYSDFIQNITIRGEISNFVNHIKSGHYYFTIKDEEAQVRCVMFKNANLKLNFKPEDGMKILAKGRPSLFVRDGQFMFYVDSMQIDGVGDLHLQFEQLKQKLSKEGLFDSSIKKPIPKYPNKIGVITASTGAAIQDILNISARRYPLCEIVIYPSLVQGPGAEDDLCHGIKYFDNSDVDTIIIGRGGGSIEDLWCFNSEKLAREIYKCQKPVISAVGHEIDFTICDFVADLRAPTPSAAAELALPLADTLKKQLLNVQSKLNDELTRKLDYLRLRLKNSVDNRVLNNPNIIFDDKRLYIERMNELLISSLSNKVNRTQNRFDLVSNTFSMVAKNITKEKEIKLKSLQGKLEALNPMAILNRGYSAVFDKDGNIVKSINDVEIGDQFSIKTSDGTLVGNAVEKRGN